MQLVWVVEPLARTVAVHTPSQVVRLLREEDQLNGGDAVPGFGVSVATLYR